MRRMVLPLAAAALCATATWQVLPRAFESAALLYAQDKPDLLADQAVATLFLAVFSIGVGVGSIAINRLLGGTVSVRYAPAAAILMGL